MQRSGVKISLGTGIVIMIFLILSFFGAPKNTFGERVTSVIEMPILLIKSLASLPTQYHAFASLRLENESLKAELAKLKTTENVVAENEYYTAKVYSTYPFNNHSLVAVNGGTAQGLRDGLPVTIEKALLFGQVIEVTKNQSVVRTIFDPEWKVPVKIGDEGVDALLVGGRIPRLTLIVNQGTVENGQAIYSANKDFPYGLKIGEVMNLHDTSDQAVKEAEVKLPFSVNEVAEVTVFTGL